MQQRYAFAFCLTLFLFSNCKTKQPTVSEEFVYEENEPGEELYINLEELSLVEEVSPTYKGAESRKVDLIHTRLDIRFNWYKLEATGTAILSFQVLHKDIDSVYVDALGMDIRSVSLKKNGSFSTIPYYYDAEKIVFAAGTLGKAGEKFDVEIHYIAKPYREDGGDQRGLYFVNPQGTRPGVPRQIWTQGETECNSNWLPTIDAPNEKMTHDFFITVDDTLQTISNGLLVKSTPAEPGMRTDHWQMTLPHAPYLAAIVVGQFHVEKSAWGKVPLAYYTDPLFGSGTKTLFQNTAEMIQFFSTKMQYPFPWPRYDQVVVHDFVSGAMENTTVSIFGRMLHLDSRTLLDAEYEDVIAHELFHQWFGDMVTCESWAQLVLNEGFASYGEYLWREYKYGKDDADRHLYQDLNSYLAEAEVKQEKLIRFDYRHPDEMFDAHSYEKGALVLHMLRNYLGDTTFFAGLQLYLKTYAFKTAEIHDLRQCMEEVSQEDLNWFFDQWYFRRGHPYLSVSHSMDYDLNVYRINVSQAQDAEPFRLPVSVSFHYGDSVHTEQIVIQDWYHDFQLQLDKKPDHVSFDSEKILLAQVDEYKPDAREWVAQLQYGRNYRDRLQALNHLQEYENQEFLFEGVAIGLTDPHWHIRLKSLDAMANLYSDRVSEFVPILIDHAENYPKPIVRAQALYSLSMVPNDDLRGTIQKGLNDSSYRVNGAALWLLKEVNREAAVEQSKKWAVHSNADLRDAALEILAYDTGDHAGLFIEAWKMEGAVPLRTISHISNYLAQLDNPPAALRLLDFVNGYVPPETNDATLLILLIADCNRGCENRWQQQLRETEDLLASTSDPAERQRLEKRRSDLKQLLYIVLKF